MVSNSLPFFCVFLLFFLGVKLGYIALLNTIYTDYHLEILSINEENNFFTFTFILTFSVQYLAGRGKYQ